MIMSKELDAKKKALALTMEKIDKTYGKGTIMKLGDAPIIDVEAISTGSIGIDLALGVGGLPKGRVVEIFGPESSGKTTLTLHAIAETQKRGGIAAFIDAEHAFDRFYAKKLGVDIDNLLISQPDCGEQALEIADNLIRSAAIDILVIDSVAALTPKSEIEGEMGESKLGLQARLMSQALRKMTATISKSGCICVFINQLREKNIIAQVNQMGEVQILNKRQVQEQEVLQARAALRRRPHPRPPRCRAGCRLPRRHRPERRRVPLRTRARSALPEPGPDSSW